MNPAEAIKSYKPMSTSLSSGQVLHCPYTHEQARLIVWEMMDQLILDLVEKGLVTNQVTLDVGYDIENIARGFAGEIHIDHYGRKVPKGAHGSVSLPKHTSSSRKLLGEILALYDRIANAALLVRRINVTVGRLIGENSLENQKEAVVEFNLFADVDADARKKEAEMLAEKREKSLQHAMLAIKSKFGKIARNQEVGGHRA